MWLLPKIEDGAIPGSPDVEVHGTVEAVDGGVHLDGQDSYLKIGDFKGKCIHNPEKCTQGLSFSCKLKFKRVCCSNKFCAVITNITMLFIYFPERDLLIRKLWCHCDIMLLKRMSHFANKPNLYLDAFLACTGLLTVCTT